MIVGIGVDAVEVARIARALERHPRFAERVFTPAERAASARRGVGAAAYLAKRWAAKEAVSKALGVGFSGFRYTDLEVVNHPSGAPSIALAGELAEWASSLGVGFSGFRYTDLEVVNHPSGAPSIALAGELAEWASSLGVRQWHLSLSDTRDTAVAAVVAEGEPRRPDGPPPWVRRRRERQRAADGPPGGSSGGAVAPRGREQLGGPGGSSSGAVAPRGKGPRP